MKVTVLHQGKPAVDVLSSKDLNITQKLESYPQVNASEDATIRMQNTLSSLSTSSHWIHSSK